MKHLDLFSGIGGFALATEMVWDNVEHIFCDNEPFAQAVLSKHWPQTYIHGDIKTLTTTRRKHGSEGCSKATQREACQRCCAAEEIKRFGGVDVLTGGFPCQPFSQAGARRGTEDSRHLWPEMLRVIREFHPRWVVGENVGGLVTWSEGLVLEQIHTDLEGEGYEVQAFIIPAVSVNAPHRRDRVWIVAHRNDAGSGTSSSEVIAHGAQGSEEREHSLGGADGQNSDAPDTNPRRIRRYERASIEKGSTTRSCDESIIANPKSTRQRTEQEFPRKGKKLGCNDRTNSWSQNWLEVATKLCIVDDGLPNGLARPRGWRNAALKGAGNAIVPQVAAEIFKVIKEIDK